MPLALLLVLALSRPALAEEDQFAKGQAVRLDPAKAYLLVRTADALGSGYFSPVLYRVISAEEAQQAETLYQKTPGDWQEKATPNVVVLSGGRPLEEGDGGRVMLAPVPPGTYLLGGIATSAGGGPQRGFMVASLAMGTVQFEARPGVITDMGHVLAALEGQRADIPELAKVASPRIKDLVVPFAVAVRPADASTPVPAAVRDIARVPADYHAAPAIPNYAGAPLTRLAPLAGVLDYDKNGDVVDLKAPHAP
jgi:hypothetical protein